MAPYHVMLLAILLFGWSLLNGYEGAEAGALDLNGSSKAGNSHPPMNSHSSVLPLPDDGPRYTVSASDPGMALFQRGVTAYNQRNPAAADTVFHEFIRTFPQSPLVEAASAFLAELLLTDPQDVQQRLAAIDAYRAVVRRFPGSANATRAAWRIGDLYAAHGWWLEAQSAYTRADGDARQSGDADRARLGLGLALSAAKRWTDAIRVLDELAARHQDDQLTPYAVVGLADALFGAKRTAEAKALYESSFTRWTDFFKQHPDSLHRYADAALLAQDDTMVRQAYLLLYNLHPQHAAVPFGLVSIGDGFRRSDRWERAHFFYATAVAQYPNTAAATVARLRLADLGLQIDAGPRDERIAPMIREAIHYAPAVILDLKGQERAFRDIADANAATAIGSEAGFRLGEHFERAQKWAEAIEAYREVSDREGRVSGDPWPAAARRRLSAILEPWLMAALKAGDEWTAMMLFHRHGTMADHAYSGKDLIVRVADAHRRAGFSAEAVKMYQTILKNPSARAIHEEALIGLGASYLDQTDFVAARKIFERYRVQYPLGRHKLDALGLLAMTLHGQGLLPEAIRLSRQWLDLSPNHADRPRMWARLGAALMDHGETALALKAYADADREGALLSPSARLRYADLLARHRAPEEALRQYQAALRLSPGEPEVQWAAIGLAGLGQDSKRAADTDAMFRDIGRMTDDPWTTRVVSALRADLSTDAGQEPD